MNQHRKVIWNSETIGHIEIIGAEMTNLYGRWHPSDSEKVKSFLQILESRKNVSAQIESDTGFQDCIVTDISDDIIEIRLENRL